MSNNDIISTILAAAETGKPKKKPPEEVKKIAAAVSEETQSFDGDASLFNEKRDAARLKNKKFGKDMEMREDLKNKVFQYLWVYSGSILFIILLQGFHGVRLPCSGFFLIQGTFHIDNMPFSILVGSTAVAVLGLPAIIMRNLFPSEKEK